MAPFYFQKTHMKFALALLMAFPSFASQAESLTKVEVSYFADHHVEASSRREAKLSIDAESDCMAVVRATFENPYSLRIHFKHEGKTIYGSTLKKAKVVRIFTEDASVRAYAPLCQLEVYYK